MGKKQKAPLPTPPDYSELERQKEKQLEEADESKRKIRARRNNLSKRGMSLLGSDFNRLVG